MGDELETRRAVGEGGRRNSRGSSSSLHHSASAPSVSCCRNLEEQQHRSVNSKCAVVSLSVTYRCSREGGLAWLGVVVIVIVA